MTDQAFDTVIVRFGGEIGIKAAWTRKLYERRLIANIKAVLKHHNIPYTRLIRKFGRLYIKTLQADEAAEKLSSVFGVSSLSPAFETTSKLDDVVSVSIRLAGIRFQKGKRFAVRCHRVGKHPYTSQDVCRQVGQHILTSLPELNLRVDLTRPEQTIQVEVREEKAYAFTDTIKGTGGLPLGTQPKTVCLLKADVPSAVACWMTMKRGCPPLLVYFENDVVAGESAFEKVKAIAQRLMDWTIGFPRTLRIIQFGQNLKELVAKHPSEMSDLLCKRFLFRVAQRLAEMEKAEGIVTGDSLGKRATQTLHAFRIQDDALKNYPVYRPLLGFDAAEVEEFAKRIGLEDTVLKKEKNQSEVKRTKVTSIELEDIERIEDELNVEQMVEDALKTLGILRV